MPFQLHNIQMFDGSSPLNEADRLQCGMLYNVANLSGAGPIASVAVTAPGSGYTAIPTLTLSGDGTGATLVPHMAALSATVVTPQSGAGSYAPADTITLTGGTETTNAVLTVASTQVVSATVAAGGSGGTNGTQTVTGTTGTGTKFQASVTVSSGAITAVLSIAVAGNYTVNPTTLTAEPVTGAGLTGATLNIKMGVLTATVSTAGSYTVLPTNPVSQGSTSGAGTSATFNITSWSVGTITVSAGGTGYDSSSALAITGGSGSGATATLAFTNVGNAVTVPVTLTDLPSSYAVNVSPSQGCLTSVTSKTNSGFSVVLTPINGSTAIAAGTFDVMVWG